MEELFRAAQYRKRPACWGLGAGGQAAFSSGKKGATTMGVFRSAGFLAEATRESIVLFE
jgi:hypothetical protein